jgi:hypothetical protein
MNHNPYIEQRIQQSGSHSTVRALSYYTVSLHTCSGNAAKILARMSLIRFTTSRLLWPIRDTIWGMHANHVWGGNFLTASCIRPFSFLTYLVRVFVASVIALPIGHTAPPTHILVSIVSDSMKAHHLPGICRPCRLTLDSKGSD